MGILAERRTERKTRLIRWRAMGLMAGAREDAGEVGEARAAFVPSLDPTLPPTRRQL
jgi:hypothetical protein